MDAVRYLLAADDTRVVVFLAGWVVGLVCFGLLSRVMTR